MAGEQVRGRCSLPEKHLLLGLGTVRPLCLDLACLSSLVLLFRDPEDACACAFASHLTVHRDSLWIAELSL